MNTQTSRGKKIEKILPECRAACEEDQAVTPPVRRTSAAVLVKATEEVQPPWGGSAAEGKSKRVSAVMGRLGSTEETS